MLVFPSAAGASDLGELRAALRNGMQSRRDAGAGSSQCPTRALVMTTPPDPDAGEITDKGYINEDAVLSRRTEAVAAMYAASPCEDVILG